MAVSIDWGSLFVGVLVDESPVISGSIFGVPNIWGMFF